MDVISDIEILHLSNSPFLQPKTISYSQKGIQRVHDCFTEYDDIVALIHNTTRNVLIFVKQFRPAVYYHNSETKAVDIKETIDTEKYPSYLGLTIEACSGIVEKEKSLTEIAQAEVLEECGYDAPLESFQRVTSYKQSVASGATSTLFYVKVTDSMSVGPGGGLEEEGEMINVVEMSIPQAKILMMDETVNRDLALVLALQWFFTFQASS